MPRTVRQRIAAVLAVFLLGGLLAAPPAMAETYSTAMFPSADGTKLHAEVWRPATTRKVPVVLTVSPYLHGQRWLLYPEFKALLRKGYAVVQVSLRGFGPSEGCGDLGGVGEQADVKAAVEWTAGQRWSTGRVGMWGLSYEAWAQVMALATKPRGLAAVLIQAPLVGLYRGLYMNGAHYGGVWHAMPASYTADDLTAEGPTDPTDAACHVAKNSETLSPDPSTAYYRERDLVARARTSRVPVLWSHGFADVNTKADNMTALYPLLRGPKRAWVGQFRHTLPMDEAEPAAGALYVREAFDWLDAYVKGDPAARRRVARQSRVVVQQGDSTWRRDDAWPPRDSRPATFALRPGTYSDLEGTGPSGSGVHWTASQRLPYAVHLSGAPRVTLTARGTARAAQVVVKVYDVAPDGAARLVTRGAHAAVAGRVSFELYPQDWRFAPAHRIAVAVQGSDGTLWEPAPVGGVTVSGASLTVPVLRYDRRYEPSLWSKGRPPAPAFVLDAATIKASETAFRLPPRLRRGRR